MKKYPLMPLAVPAGLSKIVEAEEMDVCDESASPRGEGLGSINNASAVRRVSNSMITFTRSLESANVFAGPRRFAKVRGRPSDLEYFIKDRPCCRDLQDACCTYTSQKFRINHRVITQYTGCLEIGAEDRQRKRDRQKSEARLVTAIDGLTEKLD